MSPVIGMVLILAISVVGISAVLVWGMPAIESMKEQVEYQSVQNQFQELDSTVRELVAGTAGKTAKRWQPSLTKGGINVESNSERWLVAVDHTPGYNITYMNFTDSDNRIRIANHASFPVNVMVNATTVSGASEIALNVSTSALDSTPMTLTGGVDVAAGGYQDLWLWSTVGATQNLQEITLHLEVDETTSSTTIAEAWVMDAGAIHYELVTAQQPRHVYSSNGGLLFGQGSGLYVANQPPIPVPRDSAGSHRFFMRSVQFNGTGSFSGEGRFDVLLSLYGTSTMADSSGVDRVKIYITGNLTDAWHTFFLDPTRGYNFNTVTETVGHDTRTYLQYERAGGMVFTLVHSVITATS